MIGCLLIQPKATTNHITGSDLSVTIGKQRLWGEKWHYDIKHVHDNIDFGLHVTDLNWLTLRLILPQLQLFVTLRLIA